MQFKDALEILQLTPACTLDELKGAYRRLAFACHPDLHPKDPNAAYKFQQLNQAYILVQAKLQKKSPSRETTHSGQQDQSSSNSTTQGRKQTQQDFYRTHPGQAKKRKKVYTGTTQNRSEQATGQASAKRSAHPGKRQQASSARNFTRPSREDLRQILNDPFAQEVFEEIYNYIHEQKKRRAQGAPHKDKSIALTWGNKRLSLDLSRLNLNGLKNWLRSQLDDQQTIYLPSQHLTPGATIRFQVRQSLRSPARTVTTTLPSHYIPGQAICFKGLGRKLGKWTGDLYLKVLPKT